MTNRARTFQSDRPLPVVEHGDFVVPPWDAPLSVEDALALIPASATIAGMFPLAVVNEVAHQGGVLQSARARYMPFTFYPLAEHVRVMAEACALLYPQKSLRRALRSLGRGAPAALLTTTLGRVTLGAVDDPLLAIEALAKTYALNLRPGHARLASGSSKHAVIALQDVHYFGDSHHVGVFEGVLRHVQVKGDVRIKQSSAGQLSLLLSWT